MSDCKTLADALLADPAFQPCARQDLARLLSNATIRAVHAGAALHTQGEPAKEIFFILDGVFEVEDASGGAMTADSGLLGEEAAKAAIASGAIAGTVADGKLGDVELTATPQKLDASLAREKGAALFTEKLVTLKRAAP